MPGVSGRGGPPPKRSSQRRRANKPAGGELTTGMGAAVVVPPDPDPEWHPVAARWFASLAKSGQSAFYEPSDYETAYLLADAISRELHPQPIVVGGSGEHARVEMHLQPPKAASLAAWLKGFTSLMVTEGDRRRVRLELERPKAEEAADVSELDGYRLRLASPDAG